VKPKSIAIIAILLLVTAPVFGDDATDYCNRGAEKGQKGDFNGALADFSKAIELKPDYAEAYNKRGLAKGGLAKSPNDVDSALADYNKAIELKPDYAEAYYNRGVAKQAKGDKSGALADQNKAIELKPDYAQAYANR
jgi:Flp pilus assembly protein TadD